MYIPHKRSSSGLALPSLGLGTWGMGGRSLERDPANDDSRDIGAIRYALSQGINHIDTAEIYAGGHAETLVGQALQGINRLDYTVASKVKPENHAYDDVIKSCHLSLKRLGLDYLDLYYLHAPSETVPYKDTAEALKALRSEGLIRHYGICNFDVEGMKRIQDFLDVPIAVNQSKYSLVFRGSETSGLIEHCRETGAIFAAWRPLLWRYPGKDNQPEGNAWDKDIYPMLDNIAKELGKTNSQVALNWLVSQPNVIALFKSSTIANIDELVNSIGWVIPANIARKLKSDFPDQR